MGEFDKEKSAGIALSSGMRWREAKLAQAWLKPVTGNYLGQSYFGLKIKGENKPGSSVVNKGSSTGTPPFLSTTEILASGIPLLCLLPAIICRQGQPAYEPHWAKCYTSLLDLSCAARTQVWREFILPTECPVLPSQLREVLQQQEQGWSDAAIHHLPQLKLWLQIGAGSYNNNNPWTHFCGF